MKQVGGYGNSIVNNLFDYNPRDNAGAAASQAGLYLSGASRTTIADNQVFGNVYGIYADGCSDLAIGANSLMSQAKDDIYLSACNRVCLGGNVHGAYISDQTGQPPRVANSAAVRTNGTCSRILVNGATMLGDATYRTKGVEFSATTTKSLVSGLLYDTLATPVNDINGTNTAVNVIG
jgi:parallel beta-helix repeat protein